MEAGRQAGEGSRGRETEGGRQREAEGERLKRLRLKMRVCLHAFTLKNERALRVRLPYAAPGCSRFLGRSEHTCGKRAQQEDSARFKPTPLRVWRCRLYH